MSYIDQLRGIRLVNPGILFDHQTGLSLDDDGRLVIEGTLFGEYTGFKIDDDGDIIAEGTFLDEPTGLRIDDEGWIVEDGGVFLLDESTGFRVGTDGRLYKRDWIDEKPLGWGGLPINEYGFGDHDEDDPPSEGHVSNAQQSTSSGSDSGSSIGAGGSDYSSLWLLVIVVPILVMLGKCSEDSERHERQQAIAETRAITPALELDERPTPTIFPPTRAVANDRNTQVSITENSIHSFNPPSDVYFHYIDHFDDLNNPTYDYKDRPCFSAYWYLYQLRDGIYKSVIGTGTQVSKYCFPGEEGYQFMQALIKAHAAWQRKHPDLVKYFQLAPPQPVLTLRANISGRWDIVNQDAPNKGHSWQQFTQIGTTLTVVGPEYEGKGYFNGQQGYFTWQDYTGIGRADIYIDDNGVLHERTKLSTRVGHVVAVRSQN